MIQLLCKGVQKLLGEWFFEAALLPNQNVLPCVRYVGGKLWVSTNQVGYATEKTYVYFCLSTHWYVEGGAYRVDISVQGQTR